jgi:DNA-binding HxlR family transcriptional regulator
MEKIMNKNLEIIRTEIIRILHENGKIRGADLAKRVIEKVGNEKIVYREISALVEAGEIEKKVHNRSHIEYELINLSESVNKQLKNLHKEIDMIFDEIVNFDNNSKEGKLSTHERLSSVIHSIHIVQSTDGVMKLLSYYPAFKKDKMFSQINRKINDCWEIIMNTIAHQPEDDFLNKILANLRIPQFDSKNVN